jgi:cytochrome c biogenesis protein CcmG/thiol:disulfide interchange protein DsbE
VNRTALLLGAAFVLPLLIFLAISFRFDPRAIDSPLVGREAPTFSLADLDGQVHRLSDSRGRPVVINFWATWCQPCVVEHPVLQAGARRYQGQVDFLGVVYQDEPEKIRRFVTERGAWGPSLVDPGSKVAIAYGVYGAPETFFLDENGTIVERVAGLVRPEVMERIISRLLQG